MKLTTVWDDRYHTEASGGLTSTRKQREVILRARLKGLIETVAAPAEDVWPSIATVHDPRYVHAVSTGKPRRLAESQGFTWSPDFALALNLIWAGQAEAALRAVREQTTIIHPVSGAHHAEYKRGGGFCTFNFLVGAAKVTGLRTLIVDLDAHHGNGTYHLSHRDQNIGAFDITERFWTSMSDLDPHRERYYEVPNVRGYFDALTNLPGLIDAFEPEVVFYQAGMDCYAQDYMGGITGLNASALEIRDRYVCRAVRDRNIPMVINLGGGYIEHTSARLHTRTIEVARNVEAAIATVAG